MKLVLSPNNYSCLPACFASLLEVEVAEIVEYLQHDGSEIILPSLMAPYCYKGFHIQEMIAYSLKRHVRVSIFEDELNHSLGYNNLQACLTEKYDLSKLLKENDGVVMGDFYGKRHACVWYDKVLYNPSFKGVSYSLDNFDVNIFAIGNWENSIIST